MDISSIATEITTVLVPALPYLTTAGATLGSEALKKVGGELGKEAWDLASQIWSHLKPKVEASQATQEVIADIGNSPANAMAKTALQYQIEKLLEKNPDLKDALEAVLNSPAGQNYKVAMSAGDGANQIGRDNYGTQTNTNYFGTTPKNT